MSHPNQSSNDVPQSFATANSTSSVSTKEETTSAAPWRASDDVLKQRTIFKATKLFPQKGAARASDDVIKQRRIVKINKSSFGSPPSGNLSPATQRLTPHDIAAPQHSASGSSFTRIMAVEEEVNLVMRAKLFAKVSSAWVKRGAGTLTCNCTASKRRIRLVDEYDGSIFLDVDVRQLLYPTKLIKESSRFRMSCTYIRYSLGNEVFLIQVKPELIHQLYSALTREMSS
jgi:hypothetical protein